ncbi:MAG TPA: hypothetical protein VG899_11595 [Mycobacteriales bacterium]|nr:hypothetical protein [Mycobacteriales bacterium]HWA66999.1 hypothetical protein [Mycobacteriales bacterium]HWB65239.1 hypothetical protein [Mycobacteriales bacterium]
MSYLKSQPYLPAEGTEFCDYMERVINGVTDLQREGRVPGDEGVDGLVALWRVVTRQVRADINAAGPASTRQITTTIPMTAAEFQQSSSMFETFYQLLRILEMRGAIDLRRSEGVTRVVMAVYNGTII